MSAAHTPGPWRTRKRSEGVGVPMLAIHTHDGTPIVHHVVGGHEANARLIAASPQLLAACDLLIRWNDLDLGTGALEDALAAARAAVAEVRS